VVERRRDNGNRTSLVEERADEETEARELSEILQTLSSDVGELIDMQMQLAIVEAKEELRATAKAAGWFGGAGVCTYMAAILLSFALAWGLTEIVPEGVAFLIVGAIYALAAGFLYLLGRTTAEEIDFPPPETKKSIEEDKRWLAQQMS
jgi:hypothetical protein